MLRTLSQPRWTAWLALAVLAGVAAFFLGQWQWDKYVDKTARRDALSAHYDAAPVPLRDVDLTGPLPPAQEWTRVEVDGRYRADEQLLVRNRPHNGVYGYDVLVPLQPAGGGPPLVVDRGWVPNAADATTLPEVPPPPEGVLSVTGWLRGTEPDLGREMVPGQLASIHLPSVAERTDGAVLGAYLALGAERLPDGTAPARPAMADPPEISTGVNLAYALQWWLAVPAGVIIVGVMSRREAREARASPAPPKAPRRRVWDWDEEDG